MGYIECNQRVVKFWRGDQRQLAFEHRDALMKCEAFAANWTQWQLEQRGIKGGDGSSAPGTMSKTASPQMAPTTASRPLSRREVRAAG